MKQYYQQIDIIKGFAILAVLLLHSLNKATLVDYYAVYHIWQAVPLFMVVMGLNLGLSSSAKKPELTDLYSKQYFQKRASRLVIPCIIVFIVSAIMGLIWLCVSGNSILMFNEFSIIGLLPISGPGNYFITLLLQSVLFLPIIGYGFSARASLTIVLLVLLEVLFLLFIKWISMTEHASYLYDAAFPRYFSAIAFGMALSRIVTNKVNLKVMTLLVTVAAAACVYLYQLQYGEQNIKQIRPEWQIQTILSFGYAAFLVYLSFKSLPNQSSNKILLFFSTTGKASYHIFLVQVVYFGLINGAASKVWLNLLVCLSIGFLFYKYEPGITSLFSVKKIK
ncbi:acyltransferase [Pontibacter silvestris]|uniref:Acyltransferase n=1 Tax=Pontibacter silvestris TaxID=2305183 RepID=A0ABW4WZA2_9BACT|nr:acyltransferase [Pontibacter silvestris]MCC9135376.1 acyltransferase [Pontibacter silvestris]